MKLQAGEYVSLGKIETEIKTCPIVDNVCVYAESSKQFIVALIVPNPKHLRDLAFMYGVSGSFDELCASPEVNKAVIKELTAFGQKRKHHLNLDWIQVRVFEFIGLKYSVHKFR